MLEFGSHSQSQLNSTQPEPNEEKERDQQHEQKQRSINVRKIYLITYSQADAVKVQGQDVFARYLTRDSCRQVGVRGRNLP